MESFQNGEGKNASNKQGEGKVSKTGRKKKYLIKGGKEMHHINIKKFTQRNGGVIGN